MLLAVSFFNSAKKAYTAGLLSALRETLTCNTDNSPDRCVARNQDCRGKLSRGIRFEERRHPKFKRRSRR